MVSDGHGGFGDAEHGARGAVAMAFNKQSQRKAVTLTIAVIGLSFVGFIYVSGTLCLKAAVLRWHFVSAVGICPPFARETPGEIVSRFGERIALGAPAAQVEDTLRGMGVSFSWDEYNHRYQGIIRAPGSNFHALIIHVYLDGTGGYEKIEAKDSFAWL